MAAKMWLEISQLMKENVAIIEIMSASEIMKSIMA